MCGRHVSLAIGSIEMDRICRRSGRLRLRQHRRRLDQWMRLCIRLSAKKLLITGHTLNIISDSTLAALAASLASFFAAFFDWLSAPASPSTWTGFSSTTMVIVRFHLYGKMSKQFVNNRNNTNSWTLKIYANKCANSSEKKKRKKEIHNQTLVLSVKGKRSDWLI